LISASIPMHVLEICDTDELYRRIPAYWLKPNGTPTSAAFQNTSGTDDMSVDLARLTTPEETAAAMEDCGVASFYASLARNAYSGEVGHLFQWIPATCSGAFRPVIPVESGHRFRSIPATP